jgi:N-sulfoglucosamine sulfohydrolase
MNRKIGFGLIFLAVIQNQAEAKNPPNIIWLMAEDISLDIECYGMEAVKTPVLNSLAESGWKFTNCFVPNSICSPARSAMMTGIHQLKINAHHHRSNVNIALNEKFKPFTYWLRKAGYTCILGSEFVLDNGRKTDCNFRHTQVGSWDGNQNYGLFDKLDVISPEDMPFFAQIQLKVTHRGEWWDDVRNKSSKPVNPDEVVMPPYMADHPVVRLDWAKYLDQIEYMDMEIGIIIEDLKNKGMYENTIIIFIGDNGRCNLLGKGYLYDPGLRIPLIVNWPAGIKKGEVRDDIVCATDITATILDFAGIDIPEYMTGKSFISSDFHRDYVFSTRDLWDEVMEKSRSISTKQYKYIRNDIPLTPWDTYQAYLEFYRPALHIMRKLKHEGKLNDAQLRFFSTPKPKEELYDLIDDPHELNNLADNMDYRDILIKMRNITIEEEKNMSPLDTTFIPVTPRAVKVYEFVKYHHTDAYLEMLNGKEIGFTRYVRLFQDQERK